MENAGKIVENAMRARDLVLKLNMSVREAGELPLHRITTLHTIVKEAIKATQPQWKDSAESRGIVISTHVTNGEVAIGVSDQGLGMDEEQSGRKSET